MYMPVSGKVLNQIKQKENDYAALEKQLYCFLLSGPIKHYCKYSKTELISTVYANAMNKNLRKQGKLFPCYKEVPCFSCDELSPFPSISYE